ncbi:hypothetical protein [Geomonas oryzae]|uniref:hypothetical protein n=1 Tax=Geomonas oryzae TaxID=2364273 RepID=UPI00100A7818|nr:hypothetical protein [Geomonas oryzae]
MLHYCQRYFLKRFLLAITLAMVLTGCVASRSEVQGKFTSPVTKNTTADKVSVFFQFKNLRQQHGMDTVPKLQVHNVKDFDNLFRDSLQELGNVSQYTTFLESPNDVNNPKRRKELEEHRANHDYTVEVSLLEESSFRKDFLSGTVSLLSLTLIPMPYSWDYTMTANVMKKGGAQVASYQRKATLSNWVQAALIFAYPFYPLEGKREEIYSECLHDIFKQIEAERVLK